MRYDSIPLLAGGTGIAGHATAFKADRFALLERVSQEVREIARVRLLARDLVFVNAPESVHEVLVSKARSFEKAPMVRAALHPLAGEGLFTSGGALWRRQRRLVAPVFQHSKIDAFATAMVECAQQASARWQDDSVIDVAAETTRIAMAIAGRTLFGIDTSSEADSLGEALTVALDWTDQAGQSLPLVLQTELRLALQGITAAPPFLRRVLDHAIERLEPPILWPTTSNRQLQAAIAVLDERVQRMIDQRRNSDDTKEDLLSRLLQARDENDGEGMNDKQMRDEILTLFVAGHETTANGLAWSMYSLARDKALYAQARACVDSLAGRTPTCADLERLELLSCIFKEALRLYPPVYLFGRIAIEDVSVAGYDLPKHTVVMVSPWTLQRRADLWPDPTRFDPSRFAAANQASRPRDAWIPFSDGPRVCIGAHFALLEAPLVLATLLQRADFELTSSDPVLPDESATLRPRGGVQARIHLKSSSHEPARTRRDSSHPAHSERQ